MHGDELRLRLQDKLMTVVAEEGTGGGDNVHWIFKNKDHGKAAATASLGLVTLWDVEGGLPQLDKYLYSKDPPRGGGRAAGRRHSQLQHPGETGRHTQSGVCRCFLY